MYALISLQTICICRFISVLSLLAGGKREQLPREHRGGNGGGGGGELQFPHGVGMVVSKNDNRERKTPLGREQIRSHNGSHSNDDCLVLRK